jgi:hypothetical protein
MMILKFFPEVQDSIWKAIISYLNSFHLLRQIGGQEVISTSPFLGVDMGWYL